MNAVQDIRSVMLSCLEPAMAAVGLDRASVHEDLDLMGEGVLDSLGFLQLIAALEERLAIEIDLADLDPEHLTVLGCLCNHIAAQHAAVRATRSLATFIGSR